MVDYRGREILAYEKPGYDDRRRQPRGLFRGWLWVRFDVSIREPMVSEKMTWKGQI